MCLCVEINKIIVLLILVLLIIHTRTHLNYCPLIWGFSAKSHIQSLFTKQKQGTHAVMPATRKVKHLLILTNLIRNFKSWHVGHLLPKKYGQCPVWLPMRSNNNIKKYDYKG